MLDVRCTCRSYHRHVREYLIILGIVRVERSVPKLETVFCPRRHSRLSEEMHLEMFQKIFEIRTDRRNVRRCYKTNRSVG